MEIKSKSKDELRNSIKFILQKNIICGNALNLQTVDENPKPIIFSEWSLITGSIIKRMDYYFKALSNDAKIDDLFPINKTLKSDMGQDAFIPCPIKTYPTTHFLRISDDET